MSYTNAELVRHHLDNPFPIQSAIHNQAVVLEGDDYATFFGGSVEPQSLKVKIPAGSELTRVNLLLAAEVTNFSVSAVVPGSVVVASDSSLGTVYAEGSDYAIAHTEGTITVKTGGVMTVGQTVTIWFLPYIVCQPGSDYGVDCSRGMIRRLPSGNIAAGETVYLDYCPTFVSHREEIISSAITEANSVVEQAVDPSGQFGADRCLQMAATYRALEIVCRASAARELSGLRGDARLADAWMKLGDHFDSRSELLLSSFRPARSGPSSPTMS